MLIDGQRLKILINSFTNMHTDLSYRQPFSKDK